MDFKVGDFVKFNGSPTSRHARWYHGQVSKVNAERNTFEVVDNEWFATSEVRKDRVFAWDPKEEG